MTPVTLADAVFFVPSKQRSSPYINHFIQPDTIIPDPTSPQAWNRYSYVGNNPIRFNDPSGHMRTEDEGISKRGCSDPMYCTGGQPKPTDELTRMRERHESAPQATAQETGEMCEDRGYCENTAPYGVPSYEDKEFQELMEYLRFSNNAIPILIMFLEDGRPIYKSLKYSMSLGGFEYVVDAGLQIYDDWDKDLSLYQRVGRAGVVFAESVGTDWASQLVGASAGAALQSSVPIPLVPAAAGYFVGTITTSTIVDNYFTQKNPKIFSSLGFGGP